MRGREEDWYETLRPCMRGAPYRHMATLLGSFFSVPMPANVRNDAPLDDHWHRELGITAPSQAPAGHTRLIRSGSTWFRYAGKAPVVSSTTSHLLPAETVARDSALEGPTLSVSSAVQFPPGHGEKRPCLRRTGCMKWTEPQFDMQAIEDWYKQVRSCSNTSNSRACPSCTHPHTGHLSQATRLSAAAQPGFRRVAWDRFHAAESLRN